MPTSLPVPSKGALRTLRNLALGTSCTVAISVGFLTEERRRRIRAAQEIHDNAKKLKSSSRYHSAASSAIESFQEHALSFQDGATWLPSNVARFIPQERGGDSKTLNEEKSPCKPQSSKSPPGIGCVIYRPIPNIIPKRPNSLKQIKHTQNTRQHRLARDVTKLLDETPSNVEAAALRFLDAFQQGLAAPGCELARCLVGAAAKLFEACRRQSKFKEAERIFDAVFDSGPLYEEDYHLFQPYKIMYELLGYPYERLNPTTLKRAASIYLAKFKEKPKPASEEMLSVGKKLCREAYDAKLYNTCVDLHFRIQSTSGIHNSHDTTPHLFKATHGQGNHKKMFRYFKVFVAQTLPETQSFSQIVSLVIDSVLKLQDFEKAEEVLALSALVAESAGSRLRIGWFLQVLGHNWRTFRDIARTQALFDRLQPLSSSANAPQALFIAMIQFLVEAGKESTAIVLYDKMRSLYKADPDDMRVYGHFALAKAMRQDWLGASAELDRMRDCNPTDRDTFSKCFVPVLKLYLQSHPIAEGEEFVRQSVDRFQLKLNAYVMNLMIDAYAKAKELDSIVQWIAYSNIQGVSIDSVTLGTLLNNLYYNWGFSFDLLFSFYKKITRVEGASSYFIEENSIQILRRLAAVNCSDAALVASRIEKLDSMDCSVQAFDPENVHVGMATTLGKGDPMATLKLYQHAQSRKLPLGPKHLHLAVKASLRLHNKTRESTRLIRDAQQRGIDANSSIVEVFMDRLTEAFKDGEDDATWLASLATSTIALFEKSGIQVPASVVTHTASILQRTDHNQKAIDLWKAMAHLLDMPPTALDIAALTVLYKAYVALLDVQGVRWVLQMLKTNNIVPDSNFRLVVKESQRQTIKYINEQGARSDAARNFLECILDARQQVNEMRRSHISVRLAAEQKAIKIVEQAIQQQKHILQGRHSDLILEELSSASDSGSDIEMEESLAGYDGREVTEDSWLEA